MRDLIEHAKRSDSSEGKHIAQFIEEYLLDEKVPEEEMESSIIELSEWAHLFRRRVLDRQKARRNG